MFKTFTYRSLRATKGSVAISFFTTLYEIASVVILPRNDIMTQPRRGVGIVLVYLFLFIRCSTFILYPA